MNRLWIKAEEIEVGDIVLQGSHSPDLIFADRVESLDLTDGRWVWVNWNADNHDDPLRLRRGLTVTVLRGLK